MNRFSLRHSEATSVIGNRTFVLKVRFEGQTNPSGGLVYPVRIFSSAQGPPRGGCKSMERTGYHGPSAATPPALPGDGTAADRLPPPRICRGDPSLRRLRLRRPTQHERAGAHRTVRRRRPAATRRFRVAAGQAVRSDCDFCACKGSHTPSPKPATKVRPPLRRPQAGFGTAPPPVGCPAARSVRKIFPAGIRIFPPKCLIFVDPQRKCGKCGKI